MYEEEVEHGCKRVNTLSSPTGLTYDCIMLELISI